MDAQSIAAFATGSVLLVAVLVIGCYIAFRRDPKPVPREAMFIFRVVLALAAAGFAVALSGFLEIKGSTPSFAIQATGCLAVFIVIYGVNPPERLGRRLPTPKGPRKVPVPEERIEADEEAK